MTKKPFNFLFVYFGLICGIIGAAITVALISLLLKYFLSDYVMDWTRFIILLVINVAFLFWGYKAYQIMKK